MRQVQVMQTRAPFDRRRPRVYHFNHHEGISTMIAYKLFKQRKDGSLGPLFINAKQRIPVGPWLEAEDHPTKGFAQRPGWHCGVEPVAPHLSTKGRVWAEVEVDESAGCYEFKRPTHQGGAWIIASRIRVVRILEENA